MSIRDRNPDNKLTSLTPWRRVKNALRRFLVPTAILAALGIAIYLAWSAAFAAPDGNLHLTFLDVGSADAVLIRTPGSRLVLVDDGSSPSQLSSALGQRLPLFDRRLDWLVVVSTAEQEVAALPHTMDRFPAAEVLWAGPIATSYAAEQLDGWLSANSIPLTHAYEGAVLDLGQGARLEVSSVTTLGAILLVEWQGFRALLPIGMNLDTLSATQNGKSIGPVTALLLADSGFDQVNPPAWLAILRPEVVVLSVQAAGTQTTFPSKRCSTAFTTPPSCAPTATAGSPFRPTARSFGGCGKEMKTR